MRNQPTTGKYTNSFTEDQLDKVVIAETEQGRKVRVLVTKVEADGSIWGYRHNSRQRWCAQTSYPRQYWPVGS